MSVDFGGVSFRDLDPHVITEIITKNGPRRTSRSADPDASVFNLSMFNLSEILMRQPAFNNPSDIVARYESVVSGTLGGLLFNEEVDPNEAVGSENPISMVPFDIVAKVLSMGLESPGSAVPEEYRGLGDPVEEVSGSSISGVATGQAAAVISQAKNEIGYTPGRSNNTKYHRETGVRPGLWCMVFIQAILKRVGVRKHTMAHPHTVTSLARYEAAGRAGNTPRLGAIAFTRWSRNNARVNHGAIVSGWDNTHVFTIDGNTSRPGGSGGENNGRYVWDKKRPINSIVKYGYPEYR